ncbi:hypothetical protein MHYP_G00074290 [Metynnis hypsauchen]
MRRPVLCFSSCAYKTHTIAVQTALVTMNHELQARQIKKRYETLDYHYKRNMYDRSHVTGRGLAHSLLDVWPHITRRRRFTATQCVDTTVIYAVAAGQSSCISSIRSLRRSDSVAEPSVSRRSLPMIHVQTKPGKNNQINNRLWSAAANPSAARRPPPQQPQLSGPLSPILLGCISPAMRHLKRHPGTALTGPCGRTLAACLLAGWMSRPPLWVPLPVNECGEKTRLHGHENKLLQFLRLLICIDRVNRGPVTLAPHTAWSKAVDHLPISGTAASERPAAWMEAVLILDLLSRELVSAARLVFWLRDFIIPMIRCDVSVTKRKALQCVSQPGELSRSAAQLERDCSSGPIMTKCLSVCAHDYFSRGPSDVAGCPSRSPGW